MVLRLFHKLSHLYLLTLPDASQAQFPDRLLVLVVAKKREHRILKSSRARRGNALAFTTGFDAIRHTSYTCIVIKSFANKATEDLLNGKYVKQYDAIHEAAIKKLLILEAVTQLEQLRFPPGNKLEALKGKRTGQHSIRINDQWRICFRWESQNACDVEITDYH